MNLKEELLRGIYAYGFEKPSAIQQRAIVPCIKVRWTKPLVGCDANLSRLQGMDVIAQAQSGTGKTATFSIAILQKIDTGLRECQALILAPTRELAQQIQKVRTTGTGPYRSCAAHLATSNPIWACEFVCRLVSLSVDLCVPIWMDVTNKKKTKK